MKTRIKMVKSLLLYSKRKQFMIKWNGVVGTRLITAGHGPKNVLFETNSGEKIIVPHRNVRRVRT